MTRFPGFRTEELINWICWRTGLTPAYSALYLTIPSLIIVTFLVCICCIRFIISLYAIELDQLIHQTLWVLVSGSIIILFESIRDLACGGRLERYFGLLGAVLTFHAVSNLMFLPFAPGTDRMLFISTLSWAIIIEFHSYCTNAIKEERDVIEHGKLPLVKPGWLKGLFLLSITISSLSSIAIYKWCDDWFLVLCFSCLCLVYIMVALACLMSACIPRPPSRTKPLKAKIMELFSKGQALTA